MPHDDHSASPTFGSQRENHLGNCLVGCGSSRAEFTDALHQTTEIAAEALYGAQHHAAPLTAATPELDINLETPARSLEDALTELREIWLDRAVFYHHPRYLSHLNCPIATPAVAAEVLATSLNTAVESWDQAGSAADIEQRLIRWISNALGLPASANGVFTSGGSQSNLQALAIARNKARSKADVSKLVVLTSPTAHYSVRRAADLLGISDSHFLCVSGNGGSQETLDPTALREAIDSVCTEGLTPAAVVATAGTTDRGLIDPLAEIARVCADTDIHFHVDAAYGGAAILSARHARRLSGIEAADSVTIDFHKTFYQPVACSAVILRDAHDLGFVRAHAEYLNPADAPKLNLADYSLQTTRRFDALKLWLTLRTVGPAAIGAAFDRTLDLAREVATLIANSYDFGALELYETPNLSTVLFSLRDDPAGTVSESIRDTLYDSGSAAIAITKIDGRRLMKFTILDPTLSLDDVADVLRAITRTGQRLLDEQCPLPSI